MAISHHLQRQLITHSQLNSINVDVRTCVSSCVGTHFQQSIQENLTEVIWVQIYLSFSKWLNINFKPGYLPHSILIHSNPVTFPHLLPTFWLFRCQKKQEHYPFQKKTTSNRKQTLWLCWNISLMCLLALENLIPPTITIQKRDSRAGSNFPESDCQRTYLAFTVYMYFGSFCV